MTKSDNLKKKRSRPENDEPDLLGVALRKKRHSKLVNEVEIPSLFKEDLGSAGTKKKRSSATNASSGSFGIHVNAEEERRRRQRQLRFSSVDEVPQGLSLVLSASRSSKNPSVAQSTGSNNVQSLVGTNQELVKPYLRLTTFPKPENVRPPEVLVKALQLIKRRYIKDEDFDWANEQLKSVRQDITVQGIHSKFVLDVYETHARILLENGELNEFNQCQTMIRTLTTGSEADSEDGHQFVRPSRSAAAPTSLCQSEISKDEFAGYRLLYALVQKSWTDLVREMANVRHIIHQDHPFEDEHESSAKTAGCRHAVSVVKAVTHNDYRTFFRLYDSAPHLSAYLMDFLVKRVRASAYERIVAAYRPTVSVEYFRESLCFKDLEETRDFLRQNGAVFVKENGEPEFWVDCKESVSNNQSR